MATVRLIVVLLVLGAVLLLGVQNLAPALPLVFFGGTTRALPLGIWLTGAVGLGALTTLVLTALLGSAGPSSGNRSTAYKYRPQSFYEPTGSSSGTASTASQTGRNAPPPYTTPGSRSGGAGRSPATPGTSSDNPTDDDPSWRAWTNLKSPAQWSDWESLSQAPKPENTPSSSSASGIVDSVTTWFSSSKQQAKQQQRVNESLQELDTDWDGLENRPYRAPGVSPVDDHLDDITQGWEQAGDPNRDPNRDFEASQAPRRVYRDGSLYSYSYRDEGDPAPQSSQVDNIYAPPDDVIYGNDPDPRYADTDYVRGSVYAADNSAYNRDEGEDDDLGEPEIAEDGVVDADYRVIVPPYTAAAEAAAVETWTDHREPTPDRPPGDEWDDADDALTP
ncbi:MULTISPECIES: hypothetical protein [Cyanophyceae]|uniref:hypothetical protein n=1 Tax=Cyanophyceae TaxID=3028117 RepID=UPI00168469AE|nr:MULTISPECIES: hypothetical protein [Cyanophyceae]MBD1916557.1 hypothetical protein [Phormidium sp. FACHB-77]MBD2032124.1 hypothetical protein [Phormidium sp. FACHB-322]MBD2053004.1 hypothetical protein [Leptolyngbya sp. FACHB-60]